MLSLEFRWVFGAGRRAENYAMIDRWMSTTRLSMKEVAERVDPTFRLGHGRMGVPRPRDAQLLSRSLRANALGTGLLD